MDQVTIREDKRKNKLHKVCTSNNRSVYKKANDPAITLYGPRIHDEYLFDIESRESFMGRSRSNWNMGNVTVSH